MNTHFALTEAVFHVNLNYVKNKIGEYYPWQKKKGNELLFFIDPTEYYIIAL